VDDVLAAFLEAADGFSGLVGLPEVAARWNEPSAMEGYTVGAVVGHVRAAVGWLEPLLDRPAPSDLRPIGLGKYYAGMKIETAQDAQKSIHRVVRDLSNDAAQKGVEANAQRFRSLIKRLGVRLADEQNDRVLDMRPLVPIAIGLNDFLRTRVMELVVHADDLAASVGVDAPQPSPASAAVAIDMLMATARAVHGDLAVIRALARREQSSADVFPVF
jgi:uncharacterized protein (TIGR03083 family)